MMGIFVFSYVAFYHNFVIYLSIGIFHRRLRYSQNAAAYTFHAICGSSCLTIYTRMLYGAKIPSSNKSNRRCVCAKRWRYSNPGNVNIITRNTLNCLMLFNSVWSMTSQVSTFSVSISIRFLWTRSSEFLSYLSYWWFC